MPFENCLYLIGMSVPAVLIAFCWWNWLRGQRPKSHQALFLWGLCAATLNCALWWGWVIWLKFHYTPSSWVVRDFVSAIGIGLLVVSLIAAIKSGGKNAVLLGSSAVIALLPWIPLGVL